MPHPTHVATPRATDDDNPQLGEAERVAQLNDDDAATRVEIADHEPPTERVRSPASAPAEGSTFRRDRMEALSESRRQRDVAEAHKADQITTQVSELRRTAPVQAPASEEPRTVEVFEAPNEQDSPITLRVRKQDRQFSRAERDALAREEFGDEIDALSEDQRNSFARISAARKDAENELRDRMGRIRDAAVREAATAEPKSQHQEPVQEPAKKGPRDVLAQALQTVQMGGSVDEATAAALEGFNELVESKLGERDQRMTEQQRHAAFDNEFANGAAQVAAEYPALFADANDPIFGAVDHTYVNLLKVGMMEAVRNADPDTQAAWLRDGWNASRFQQLSASDAKSLFRDMKMKDYVLPDGPAILRAAAKLTSQRFGTPQPGAPTADHPKGTGGQQPLAVHVDRSDRKTGIVQPERATVPKATGARATVPPSEQERAANNRREIRGRPGAGR